MCRWHSCRTHAFIAHGTCQQWTEDATSQRGGNPGSSGAHGIRYSVLAWGALFVVGLVLGYNWVVMKSGLGYAHPAVFAAMRVSLAGVVLFVMLAVTRRPLRPPRLGLTTLVGLFGVSGSMGLIFWALQSGAAGKTSILVYTMPIWLLILSWLFLGERVRGYRWLFAGLTLAGLVFVISPWGVQGTVTSNLLAVGAGVCGAVGSIFAKILCRDREVDLLSLSAWQLLIGAVPLIVVAVIVADSGPQWTGWFLVILLYNVLLASALSMSLWFFSLRHLAAGTAGLGRLLVPVVGVSASFIQLGERPDGYEIAGMALIMVGLGALAVQQFVGDRRQRKRPPQDENRLGELPLAE